MGTFTAIVQPIAITTGAHPFAAFFHKAMKISAQHTFEINGTLDTGKHRINPVAEDVSLRFGTYSVTIPKGSFKRLPKDTYLTDLSAT